jgi:hypothetical protein
VVHPQLSGAEHESHDRVQWAAKPCHLPKWKCRHLPQTGLQPKSAAGVVQVTGVAQPQAALVVHEISQVLPHPHGPPPPA